MGGVDGTADGFGWCAVTNDEDNYMKTYGKCKPGCTLENDKLVQN